MDQTCNVGGLDKQMRLAVGIASAAYTLFGEGDTTKKVAAGAVSAIALTTALSGYCPLNDLAGVNTCADETLGNSPATYS
jgi:hypothetical protein